MRQSILTSTILLAVASRLPITNAADSDNGGPLITLNEDESFNFDLLGALGHAISGGADIAPVLRASKEIIPGDFHSFFEVFYALANKTKAEAMDPANAYNPLNVQNTWFAAANYFRHADFYLKGNWENPFINLLWEEQLAAFDKGLAAMSVPGRRLQIPADNFTVEAIWYTPPHKSSEGCQVKRPTIILGNGYDAPQENLHHTLVGHALALGWNCLTYEGPGQPTVRRKQDIGFIPDWERVVTPVVDYLLSEQAQVVDPERLALFGNSMGGYLAARAAAFEPRIKALMLDGGVWNVYDSFMSHLTPEVRELHATGQKETFDNLITTYVQNSSTPTVIRWGVEHGMWAFKTRSPFDFLEQTKAYTLEGISDRIQAPVWIADAEYEGFFRGQPQLVKDALGDNATLHAFTGEAGYHCQPGAYQELARVLFAWLNKTLN